MQPLLDYIFGKLDLKHLDRDEVKDHLLYLEEIIIPTMPVAQQVKYLAYKVQLNRRLVQIDKIGCQQTVSKLSGAKAC